jgi:hypothetical protein
MTISRDAGYQVAVLMLLCLALQCFLVPRLLTLSPKSQTELFLAVLPLAVSSAISILILFTPTAVRAVRFGLMPGILLGLTEMASITLETAPHVSPWLQKGAPPISMAVMIFLFGFAGSLAYRRTSSFRLALINGLTCAIVGTALTTTFGLAYTFAFRGALAEARQTNASRVLADALAGSQQHWLIAPVLALIFSGFGVACEMGLRNCTRRLAYTLFGFAVLFLVAGMISLVHASGLMRVQRPPFVMFGMLACAIVLSFAYPFATSVWHRRH